MYLFYVKHRITDHCYTNLGENLQIWRKPCTRVTIHGKSYHLRSHKNGSTYYGHSLVSHSTHNRKSRHFKAFAVSNDHSEWIRKLTDKHRNKIWCGLEKLSNRNKRISMKRRNLLHSNLRTNNNNKIALSPITQ